MNKKGFSAFDKISMFIILVGIIFLFLIVLPLVMYGQYKTNENIEEFCISKAMEYEVINEVNYCMDNYEDKLYLIIPTFYDHCWFLSKCIQTDFKLVKEVVTLE